MKHVPVHYLVLCLIAVKKNLFTEEKSVVKFSDPPCLCKEGFLRILQVTLATSPFPFLIWKTPTQPSVLKIGILFPWSPPQMLPLGQE